MLRSLISFVLIASFFWFFPDIYLWLRNASNALFQEAANLTTLRVEVKVAKPVPILPIRYGVLSKGEKDYYVELYSSELRRAIGASTRDGTAVMHEIGPGTYDVRVGRLRNFSDIDLHRNVQYGEPLLTGEELLPTTLPTLVVDRDIFAVAVLAE